MTSYLHRIPIRIAILAGVCALQAAAQPVFLASGQPKDLSVSVGANVTNWVAVAGATGAVTYQWWFNDSPLAGATNRRLMLLNVQPAQAGNYFAVAADTVGAVTSRVAQLEVDATFTKITTGPIATDLNCAAEGSAVDYDRDGDLDLFVSGFGQGRSAFYRNDGDGTFTRLTDTNALPFLAPREALPAAWGDYDHDGFLGLLVTQYGTRAPLLFRNDGRGGFTKATTNQVGALAARGNAWTPATARGRCGQLGLLRLSPTSASAMPLTLPSASNGHPALSRN